MPKMLFVKVQRGGFLLGHLAFVSALDTCCCLVPKQIAQGNAFLASGHGSKWLDGLMGQHSNVGRGVVGMMFFGLKG